MRLNCCFCVWPEENGTLLLSIISLFNSVSCFDTISIVKKRYNSNNNNSDLTRLLLLKEMLQGTIAYFSTSLGSQVVPKEMSLQLLLED